LPLTCDFVVMQIAHQLSSFEWRGSHVQSQGLGDINGDRGVAEYCKEMIVVSTVLHAHYVRRGNPKVINGVLVFMQP
jgi:hypothetical protein